MNNTNVEKFSESEKLLSDTPTSFSVDHEAQLLNPSDESNKKSAKMYQTRRLLALLVVFGLLALGVVSASPKEFHIRRPFADCSRSRTPAIPPQASPSPPAPEEVQRFKELLNTVEPASLHEILHKHLKEKYQHGVYQEDRTAMEVVHKQDAAVAQSLVELAKRQASNTTTVATTSVGSTIITTASTSSVAPSSSVVSSVVPSTSTAAPTTSALTTVVTSSSQAPTRSETSTQAPTTSGVRTSSQATQTSSSPRTSNTTPTTGAETNSPASDSSITQQVVFKTTLANGAQSTVTSVTVVPANQAQSGGSSKTTGGTASLQTNAASSRDIGVNALFGVLGMAAVAAL